MGCSNSKPIVPNQVEITDDGSVHWKILPSFEEAMQKYIQDGTLTKHSKPAELEFRTLLDEPLAMSTLGKFAKERQSLPILFCWVDIQDYKSIPTGDYRRSKALHIHHKYIKEGSILEVGGIDYNERIRFKTILDESKTNKDLLTFGLFDKLQHELFKQMYHNIFMPFKSSHLFQSLTKSVKQKYNNVRIEDFVYYQKLGEGGFGLVVHCMKKSTGKHFAMKIQTKKGLLDCFNDDPSRVDYEKNALASCQHPFIINMDYSFQTKSLAIMVLGLATAGDLQKALLHCPEERLSADRVRFYMAEVVLALGYLHQKGFMYRDLKPNNILLNSNGHIQLVDLGGVVDQDGNLLDGKKDMMHDFSPMLYRPSAGSLENESLGDSLSNIDGLNLKPKRRMSIMGTFGYMAPEMVIMLSQASSEKSGYSNTVDWWSLGVTTFKLLTGYRPFTEENFNQFVEFATSFNGKFRFQDASPEYAMLFQEINFPSYVSPTAKDFITRLLDVNEKSRLGSGSSGLQNIKNHPFFSNIDWELLEQKHIEPPFKPIAKSFDDLQAYSNFETMMKDLGKDHWLVEDFKEVEQVYFSKWDFTSPQTLRVEFGIANEMEQYDKNFKVRQVFGDKNDLFSQKRNKV